MSSIAVSSKFSNPLFDFLMRTLFFVRCLFSFFLGGERCLCCGKMTLVAPLCGRCSSRFLHLASSSGRSCGVCGKPLVSEIGLCTACRDSRVVKTADRIFPIQTYRLWKKNLLFSWKMQEKRSLSPFFAAAVEKKIRLVESELGFENLPVVPVPPRPGKIRSVGWDQIDELCFYLHFGYGREILPLLERKSKVQQKKLGRGQRLETIGSSYFPVNEKKFQKILSASSCGKIPKSVILLDDVMTTGATLEDCSIILKKMGVAGVYCVTLFIVA